VAARYFVDENLLDVGRALAAVRGDVVHPGHPELPEVPLGALDPDWLPVVGAGGLDLVVITRDRGIRRKPVERQAYVEHRVRAFFLVGKEPLSGWEKLTFILRHWEKLEKRVADNGPGPWGMSITVAGRFRDLYP
jgi:PIN like domain